MADRQRRFVVEPPLWKKATDVRDRAGAALVYAPKDDGEFCRFLLMKGIAAFSEEVGRS